MTSLISNYNRDLSQGRNDHPIYELNNFAAVPQKIKGRIEFLTERARKTMEELKGCVEQIKNKIPFYENISNKGKEDSIGYNLFYNNLKRDSKWPACNASSQNIDVLTVSLGHKLNNDTNSNLSEGTDNDDDASASLFSNDLLNEVDVMIHEMNIINKQISTMPEKYEEIADMAFNSENGSRRCKKYNMYDSKFKKQCCEMAKAQNIKTVSLHFKVPIKSLKRWLKVGYERKKGGGRKIKDPKMEELLYRWYQDQTIKRKNLITSNMIKMKALEFKSNTDFHASKGWLEKFKKKYKLNIARDFKKTHAKINSGDTYSDIKIDLDS